MSLPALALCLLSSSILCLTESTNYGTLEQKLDQVLEMVLSLQNRIEDIENNIKSDQVSFTVYHDADTPYQRDERIQYNTVLTNLGGGYMMGQHDFVCPVSGMYMFTWTAVAHGGSYFFSDMYMNDDIIASSWANSADAGGGAQSASNAVFIHCESGSRVYIQCGPDYNCRSRAHQHGLQTFAGFLVNAED